MKKEPGSPPPGAAVAPRLARIMVRADAHEFARANAYEHLPNETGGIVIGSIDGTTALITCLTGPGPNAVHRPDWFVRDGAYAQAILDGVVAESGGMLDYLGEWHSHPVPQGPSARDRQSMHRISRNPDYGAPHPLLLLCRRYRRGWRLEGYCWDAARLVPIQLSEK